MMTCPFKLGDIVEVTTHRWDNYGLNGAIAIVSPPVDPAYDVSFQLVTKTSAWMHPYFNLTEEFENLRVIGHLDV